MPIHTDRLTSASPSTLVLLTRPGSLFPQPDLKIAPQLALGATTELSRPLSSKLYLVPTPQGLPDEEVDPLFLPKPSSLAELPEITPMVENYVIGVMEIWSGRRSALQLARSSHRNVYQKLLNPPISKTSANQSAKPSATPSAKPSTNSKSREISQGARTNSPRIRKIYIAQPIEGVLEVTATLRFGERVRSLILRFEGVDRRWLCTEFELL